MKVTQQGVEKPKYVPITITLETAEEYFSLLGVLGESTSKRVRDGMEHLGVGYLYNPAIDYNYVHQELNKFHNKVKETL